MDALFVSLILVFIYFTGPFSIDDGASWGDASEGKGYKLTYVVLSCICYLLIFFDYSDLLVKYKYVIILFIVENISTQIALGGRYSRDYFNRYGELRHIRQLRFWPLNKVLTEKYDFSEQDANDMAEFLTPLLDFAPEKRPTAAQCLSHAWLSSVPRNLECSVSSHQNQPVDQPASTKVSEKDEREAMEIGMGNIAIDGTSKSASSKST